MAEKSQGRLVSLDALEQDRAELEQVEDSPAGRTAEIRGVLAGLLPKLLDGSINAKEFRQEADLATHGGGRSDGAAVMSRSLRPRIRVGER